MTDRHWVQFQWDLTKLPVEAPPIDNAYSLRLAKLPDSPMLEEVMRRSYMSEPAWTHDLHARIDSMRKLVQDDLADQIMSFFALTHGSRIIGAVVANHREDATDNLPAGVCVLDEYRCRGLGTHLLHRALSTLKDKGLSTARTHIKRGLTGERFLYAKFGGTAQEAAAQAATT